MPTGDDISPIKLIEQAWIQFLAEDPQRKEYYGDPERGATVVQAWRTTLAVSGMKLVCLLSSGKPDVDTAEIPVTSVFAPGDLAKLLAHLLTSGEQTASAATAFVNDGKSGHSITLLGATADASSFRYYDPWPGESLLAKAQNAAGVDAQPEPDGAWRITGEELQRVLVGVFIDPTAWADLNGVEYRIPYEELQESDFWKFFHLSETAREEAADARTLVKLQPGGFADKLDLELELGDGGRVRRALLALDRSWVANPETGLDPFALDIAASFVRTLTPPACGSPFPLDDRRTLRLGRAGYRGERGQERPPAHRTPAGALSRAPCVGRARLSARCDRALTRGHADASEASGRASPSARSTRASTRCCPWRTSPTTRRRRRPRTPTRTT